MSAETVVLPAVPPAPVRLSRLLVALGVGVAAFDICFWGINAPGFSVGVFFPVLAGVILSQREGWTKFRSVRIILGLLLGASFAAMIETGVTNSLCLLILIAVLAGETWFRDVAFFAGRILSQGVAFLAAPGRPFWLAARILEVSFGKGLGWTGSLLGKVVLILPALVLALVFGSLLAEGNAVFGVWTGDFFDWLWKQLALYLNPARIFLWFFIAFLMLPLLVPSRIGVKWWKPTYLTSPMPALIPASSAVWGSALMLGVLNLLFLVANVADALFLWSGESLPKGVTYSGFVHSGTEALISTALLSALVLVSIFQQEFTVSQNRFLRMLGLLWIAQNLYLLLSVGYRLKLYIEAYDMTVLRLSVIIFLVLVAAGYVLLTIKILRNRSLAWLIGGCAVAVFATFYITQFLDLGGWSANYNVAQWEKDRSKNLDVCYLYSLGPAAWPAISRAAKINPSFAIMQDKDDDDRSIPEALNRSLYLFDSAHWREFSLRAYWNHWALDDKK